MNYNDLLPSDLYRFNLIHYLVWWFPLLGAKARGEWLTLEPRENGGSSATIPEIGVYRWSWRVTPSWWWRVFPRPEK